MQQTRLILSGANRAIHRRIQLTAQNLLLPFRTAPAKTPVRAVRDSTDSQCPKAAFEIARTRGAAIKYLRCETQQHKWTNSSQTQGRRAREEAPAKLAPAAAAPSDPVAVAKQAVARADRLVLGKHRRARLARW